MTRADAWIHFAVAGAGVYQMTRTEDASEWADTMLAEFDKRWETLIEGDTGVEFLRLKGEER